MGGIGPPAEAAQAEHSEGMGCHPLHHLAGSPLASRLLGANEQADLRVVVPTVEIVEGRGPDQSTAFVGPYSPHVLFRCLIEGADKLRSRFTGLMLEADLKIAVDLRVV